MTAFTQYASNYDRRSANHFVAGGVGAVLTSMPEYPLLLALIGLFVRRRRLEPGFIRNLNINCRL